MKILITVLMMFATSAAFAGPECTKEDKSKWMDQEKFKADRIAEGYTIKVFKVTKGNCYEIYGKNKDGKKIEIYYNPISAEKVKENIK